MRLFEIRDFVVSFSPQALLLAPFKALWTRDKSKNKVVANAELAFVYYMEDVRSDFYDIIDPKVREEEVLKYLTDLPKGWKQDEAIEEARKFYVKQSETLSVKFLQDAMLMINKLRTTMRDIDFNERDKGGKPIHDYGKAFDFVNKIPDALRNLKSIYKQIEDEAKENDQMRGGRLKSGFEDGL